MTSYQQHAIIRTKLLNRAEQLLRKTKGQHPAFPWSDWGDRPRAGALWSEAELESAKLHVAQEFKGSRLPFTVFADLAWLHGRSANGIHDKLKDVMGKMFYKTFEYI